MSRTNRISLVLLWMMASAGVSAQVGNETVGSGADSPLGIEISGNPMFKVYELTDTGCDSGETRLDVRQMHLPANAHIHTVVEAGGLRYMNEQFPRGPLVALNQNWGLFDLDDGGTFSPLTGTWPIPDNTPMTVNFYIRDGFDGTILYQRDVEISQCNGGEITSNQVVGEEVSQPTRATFVVTKLFTDGNDSEVEVTIDCNTGLILDQDKAVTPDVPIEFVVTSFTNETLNCTISETPVEGYTGYHLDADADVETEFCEYGLVEDGEQGVCAIINEPDPVEIIVTKQWEIIGDNNDVSLFYDLDLNCNSGEILDDDDQNGVGPDTEVHVFEVIPDYPGTTCSISESVIDSAIEIDQSGCQSLNILAGVGDSCTITNTVFFEGIPSLNQYGMAILALLMLGLGMIGFRRFV